MKARVSYQEDRGSLGVEFVGDEGHSEMEYQPRIALRNARVEVKSGYRAGCGRTGYLGFFTGETRMDQQECAIAFEKAIPVAWNGYNFVTPDGYNVETAAEVYIIGKTALVVGVNQ